MLLPPVLMIVFLPISPHRTENAEANLPEGQEFLSGVEEKKTMRFTDVSSIKPNSLLSVAAHAEYTQYLHVVLVVSNLCISLLCLTLVIV